MIYEKQRNKYGCLFLSATNDKAAAFAGFIQNGAKKNTTSTTTTQAQRDSISI